MNKYIHTDTCIPVHTQDEDDPDEEVQKYLIKWKDMSYLHTSWETEVCMCVSMPAYMHEK
jgi:hypothetical protein